MPSWFLSAGLQRLIGPMTLTAPDWLAVDPLNPPSLAEINSFLRDHFTNEATKMEPKLIATVVDAAQQFKSDVANVVSGFRHPKYNLMLRKKGHQVARDSQHTHGNAVDFRIKGVGTRQVLHYVRSLRVGGVGFYPHSQFVHSDTGRVRYWTGS